MNRDEFFAKFDELLDFAYARSDAYPEDSNERGIWRRVAMAFELAKQEFPE